MSHLQLLFEELIMQGIIPHLDRSNNRFPIQAVIEYSEAERTTTLSIHFGGDRFDPITDTDEISARLSKGFATETSYISDSDNCLVVVLSERKLRSAVNAANMIVFSSMKRE